MRKGERNIYLAIAGLVVVLAGYQWYQSLVDPDPGIPFYTTASAELRMAAEEIYKQNNCSDCHRLWMVRNWYESVPAPSLDGIGSLKTEDWLYEYLSAENPQAMLPSRLRTQYKMPSYAHLPEEDRRMLAAYLASLKVEDWYLDEVKRAEFEALTGETFVPAQ